MQLNIRVMIVFCYKQFKFYMNMHFIFKKLKMLNTLGSTVHMYYTYYGIPLTERKKHRILGVTIYFKSLFISTYYFSIYNYSQSISYIFSKSVYIQLFNKNTFSTSLCFTQGIVLNVNLLLS